MKGRKARYYLDKRMKARVLPPVPMPPPISASAVPIQSFVDEFVAKSSFIERLGASAREDAELASL